MSDTEEQIICLNYCMIDQASGYCLTCGRPPIPVTPVDAKAGTLALKAASSAIGETPDQTA